jgi:DNA invertase Pin-like site-specific DNA recombinase
LLVAIALNALEDVADGGGFNGTEGTMNIGYARTSTVEQEASFEARQAQLKAAGCEKVFCEQVSAVSPEREQLEAALDYVRDGDVLIVTKLDRLARSVPNLCEIGQRLDGKGVGLKVLDQAIDTTTPTGPLMFNMLGAIAQFERELIRERMLVGIAKAKAEGKYRGRAPTARMQAEKVRQLKAAGVGPSEIARQLGIGRMSMFRILTAA